MYNMWIFLKKIRTGTNGKPLDVLAFFPFGGSMLFLSFVFDDDIASLPTIRAKPKSHIFCIQNEGEKMK